MSNQYLKLRRSGVPGKIPSTSSIDFGEIALNTYDGLAYMKKSGSNGEEVVPIGSNSGSFSGSFTGTFSGSLYGTASWAENYNETDPIFTAVSGTFATTGSNVFKGNQIISGSVDIFIPEGSAVGQNENPTSNNVFWSYPPQDTNTAAVQVGWTAQVQGGGTYTVTDVQFDTPFAPFIAITLSDPSLTLGYRVFINFSSTAKHWRFTNEGNTYFPGNVNITGSVNFNNGASIVPNLYPNGLDIIAAPGPNSYASLTSNNTQSFVFVNNDGAYVQTLGGTYQWEFRDDGYFVIPQVQSLTKQAGILSAGDIIIQADESQSWRFSSGSGILYAPGAIEAPSFTGSLYGTASWALNALTASYTPGITNNGTQYYVPVWKDSASLGTSSLYESGSVLKTVYGGNDIGLKLDFANALYSLGQNDAGILADVNNQQTIIGDFNNFNNLLKLIVDDLNSYIKTSFLGNDTGLKLDFANTVYQFGQITGGNQTYITIDDVNREIKTTSGGVDIGLKLDLNNNKYYLGEYNGGTSSYLILDPNAGSVLQDSNIKIGDGGLYQNGTFLQINDPTNTVSISGSTTITGSLNVTGGITGSLHGTASWALNAQTASNILGGKAPHVPFFITDTTLATSSIYQSGSSTVIINQDAATSANPEALYVWQPSTSSFNVISGKGNLDNYLQLNIQNTNQGPNASSDVVATANNGDENTNYVNMGINSQNYAGFLGAPNDAYLYSTGEDLLIGNYSDGKNVYFFNSSSANPLITLTPSNTVDIPVTLNAPDITGSLEGTASWARNVISASHAVNADFAGYAATAGTAANGGVTQILAGSGITLIPSTGVGAVTVIAGGGGGGVTIISGSLVTGSFTNATSFTFNHNLNTRTPIITVFDSNYNQVIPESIQLIDTASALITFPTPESGFAIGSTGGTTGTALSSSYSLFATYADTASFYAETDPVFVARSASLATTGSNVFRGTQRVSGSVIVTGSVIVSGSSTFTNIGPAVFTGSLDVSGSGRFTDGLEIVSTSGLTFGGGVTALNSIGTELRVGSSPTWGTIQMYANGAIKYSHGTTLTTLANTTINLATANVQLGGVGIIKFAVNDLQIGSVDTFFTTVTEYVSGSIVGRKYSNGNYYIGSNPVDSGIKLDVSGSGRFTNGLTVTGSLNVSGSTTQTGNNTLIGNTVLSGSINISGSQTFNGTSAFYGNHTLSGSNTITGNTIMSGSIVVSGSSDFKNSVFIVTGSAFFKGTHQVSGSTAITGSFSVRDGDINIVSGSSFTRWGNKLFNYGQFSDTTTQSGSANTAYAMKFNTTDFALNTRIVSQSRITVDNTGIYNLQFSAQLGNTANTAIDFDIWFAYTGSNIANSNTNITINKVPGSLGRTVAAWNLATPIQAGDYVEIYWSCNAATGQIQSAPTQSAPARPAIPSIIATLTQIA